MKHWIAAVLALGSLIAAWKLPPESVRPSVERVPTELQLREATLGHEFRVAGEALRRHRWADSLSALVVERAVDGLMIAAPAGVPQSLLDELERDVRADLDELGALDGDRLFGFVFQTRWHAPYPHSTEVDVSARERTETFAGVRNGREYCISVVPVDPSNVAAKIEARLGRTPSFRALTEIGACRPYLRHGEPGAHVRRWLENGALALASGAEERVALPEGAWVFGRRTLFGITRFANGLPIETDQCLAGSAEACAVLLLDPVYANPRAARELEIARLSPATSVGSPPPYGRWLPDFEYLLADLEQEHGSAAFRSFWTSNLPVDAAFREAFGVDIGAWTVAWIDSVTGVDEPGPGLPRSASTSSLLAVALLFGLSYARMRRRSDPVG